MKKFTQIFLVLYFFLFSIQYLEVLAAENPSGLTLDVVVIYSVSTNIKILNYQPQGSIEGGTYLYIKASGLDQTSSNNVVKIGPYDCPIPEKGINEIFLTCQTDRAFDPKRRWELPVTIQVKDKQLSTCAQGVQCQFTYTDSATPFLRRIFPSAISANNLVTWNGIWRVSSTSEIRKLKIGSQICDRFQVDNFNNLNDDSPLDRNQFQSIPCRVAFDQEAGLYNSSVDMLWGQPYQMSSSYSLTKDGKEQYQFMVVPSLTGLSSNTGGTKGQQLIIKGTGFGSTLEDLEIKAAGRNCVPKVVQMEQVICDVEEGESNTETDYISGQGFRMSLFFLEGSSIWNAGQLQAKVRSDLQFFGDEKRILKEEIIGALEIEIDPEIGERQGAWIRGYFLAPRDGIYNFRATQDDSAQVYINLNADSSDIAQLTKIIDNCAWTQPRFYYYPMQTCNQVRSEDLTLEEGKKYYMEIFIYNGGSNGHLMVSVETPVINDQFFSNSEFNSHQINIKANLDYQIWKLKVLNDQTPFSLKTSYTDPKTRKKTYEQESEQKKWDEWSEADIRNTVNWLVSYYVECEVVMSELDASSQVCGAGCISVGREWVITFKGYRPPDSAYGQPLVLVGISGSNLQKTREQDTPVRGTYKLFLQDKPVQVWDGKWTTSIPYTCDSQCLKRGIQEDTQWWDIESYQYRRADDGFSINLEWRSRSIKENIPLMTFENSLTSGKGIPTIEIKTAQEANKRPFYEPVPGDMIFTQSYNPSVILTKKGISAQCLTDCSYLIDSTKNIVMQSFTITQSELSITFDAQNIFNADQKITVFYAENECLQVSVQQNVIKCQIPQNQDSTNQLVAGTHIPIVHVQNIGYADQGTVSNQTVQIAIDSLSSQTASINGGVLLTLTGVGFPLKCPKQGVLIKFGLAEVGEIKSCSNTQIQVIVPKKNPSDTADQIISLSLIVNGQEATSDFTYSTAGVPTVTSIDPENSSPVKKQTLTITGTNFGTDKSLIKVFLDSAAQTYELNVNSVTDTSIISTLGGGKVGDYKVRVQKSVVGDSIGDIDFQYVIKVNSVSPSFGSVLGGTTITINGNNFSPLPSENLVYLVKQDDQEIYQTCPIQTVSSTQITCETLPLDNPLLEGVSLYILVQVKLQEDSTTQDMSQIIFTYQNSKNGSISAVAYENQSLTNGQQLSFGGTGFTDQSQINLKIINKQSGQSILASGSVSASSQIQFTVPSTLVQGSYLFSVKVDNLGYFGFFSASIDYKVTSVSSGPVSFGGGVLTLEGSGFRQSSKVNIGSLGSCQILTIVSAQQLKCVAPASQSISQDTQYSLVLSDSLDPLLTYTCLNCVQYQKTKTIEINSFSPISISTPTSFVISIVVASGQPTSSVTGDIFGTLLLQTDTTVSFKSAASVQTLDSVNPTFSFTNVPAGSYSFTVEYLGNNFAKIKQTPNNLEVEFTSLAVQNGPLQVSKAGGKVVTITGEGWNTQNIQKNQVKVCGTSCIVQSVTSNSLSCTLESIRQKNLFDTFQVYSKTEKQIPITYFGSDNLQGPKLSDNQRNTFYSPKIVGCNLGYDFGEFNTVLIDKIEYMTRIDSKDALLLKGIKVQTSNDNSTWNDLFQIAMDANIGINIWRPLTYSSQLLARYVRFINPTSDYCQLSEFLVFGQKFYYNEDEDVTCDLKVKVNSKEQTLISQIVFKESLTANVLSVNPYYGSLLGGDSITIQGTGFGSTGNQVKIDGVPCTITTQSATQIVCTTGNKFTSPLAINPDYEQSNIEVLNSEGNKAIVSDQILFFYGLLWSEESTWGGESAPRSGDTVFVPKDQVLIVDISSPVYLNLVAVEGVILFADTGNLITFDVEYLIVRMGRIVAGTEKSPYEGKLIITLYGTYEGKQLPEFGNKVIGCHSCKLDFHGKVKNPTWTYLASTANIGDNQITLQGTQVDWNVGDQIVIATTSFDPLESEEVTITQIGANNLISFTPSLKFMHYSAEETYGTYKMAMRAEVGLLTRNIVIQGDNSDSGWNQKQYGGHLMIHGKTNEGTRARISYTEFRLTGQPAIIGRYAIHFHMNGDCAKSYALGNSIHDSNARMVALHAVSYLRVQQNVGFKCGGHNIFLEDGIETNNIIEYNLIVSAHKVTNMLQTDMTAAGMWITHPTNYVRYNAIVGADFYGMWWEVKEHPDGPSATSDVCPEGMPLGALEHNSAHSCRRFGLRFFVLAPREKPCQHWRNETALDPYADNPSIQQVYDNFTTYKNGESGVLAEEMGNAVFKNFKISDSIRAGFQLHKTNFSKEEVIFKDSLIVGISGGGNGGPVELHLQQNQKDKKISHGILFPRTDGFRAKNIEFHNFIQGMHLVEFASDNEQIKLWVQGGKQATIEGVVLVNCSSANTVLWQGPRRNIIFDADGSLTKKGVPTYISPYKEHFEGALSKGECVREQGESYDDSVLCSVPLRGLIFRNLIPLNEFKGMSIKLIDLGVAENLAGFGIEEQQAAMAIKFSETENVKIKNKQQDAVWGYAVILPVGHFFNVHWNLGIDWEHLLIQPSIHSVDSDAPIVLRFNHTLQREVFDIKKMLAGKVENLQSAFYSLKQNLGEIVSESGVPSTAALMGDHFVDYDKHFLYLAINSKGRSIVTESIDLNGVFCRFTCEQVSMSCEKEMGKIRLFSEATQWTENETSLYRKLPTEQEWQTGVPQNGDDVLIPCPWIMKFDLPSFTFGTLVIDGILQIDSSLELTHIKANNIWVRTGTLMAGTEAIPFESKLIIELIGTRTSPNLIIDELSSTGTKSIAVTGKILFNAPSPQTIQTKLFANAKSADTSIQVLDAQGWQVDDEIVIGGSFHDGKGHERFKIASIVQGSGFYTIGLKADDSHQKSSIQFFHFGDSKKTVGSGGRVQMDEQQFGGDIDMRASVGHVSRKIKLLGSKEDSLGGHLQVYHWILQEEGKDINQRGSIYLNGVEFQNMGQKDSENAGLHVIWTNTEGDVSSVLKSSFSFCDGICVSFEKAQSLVLDENVFYDGQRFMVKAMEVKKMQLTKNLFLAIRQRIRPSSGVTHLWDPTAAIYMYTPQNVGDELKVQNNILQGSEGVGYVFPSTPCEDKENHGIKGNIAGNILMVGIMYNSIGDQCHYHGDNSVYQAEQGFQINPKTLTQQGFYLVDKVRTAECNYGVIMRSGTAAAIGFDTLFTNGWIGGPVRDEFCEECYENSRKSCSNLIGFKLFLATFNGESFPLKLLPLNFDVVCSATSPFMTQYIRKTVFYNYKETYPSAAGCVSNFVFRNNPGASDAVAGHFLKETVCQNCGTNSYASLSDPKEDQRGWFGGCGDGLVCTGLENILIQDQDGTFFGTPKTIISMNELVGDHYPGCESNTIMNAFICEGKELGILEFEGTGSDRKMMSSAPATLDNGVFANVVNMWREWEWNGAEPMNRRQNTYTSIIQFNTIVNLTYKGNQPATMIYKLGQRIETGESDAFLIIQNQYPSPLSIKVAVDGTVIKSFSTLSPANLSQKTNICGANNYFPENRTIHFVVNGAIGCNVQISLANLVQITLRLAMTQEQFFADDAETKFIDKISAFLNIPFDRVRIVGLKPITQVRLRALSVSESEVIIAIEDDQQVGAVSNGYNPSLSLSNLNEISQNLEQALTNGSIVLDYTVNSVTSSLMISSGSSPDGTFENYDGQNQTKKDQYKDYAFEAIDSTVGLVMAIVFALLAVGIIAYMCVMKSSSVVSQSTAKVQNLDEKQILEEKNQTNRAGSHIALNLNHQTKSVEN